VLKARKNLAQSNVNVLQIRVDRAHGLKAGFAASTSLSERRFIVRVTSIMVAPAALQFV
jgi:hypothetical protein